MERKMRRLRQELSESETKEIICRGKAAVMAVAGDDDPYAVPVNYVYDGECVYIHSASEGHKIDALRRNPKCSLCVIDKDDIVPEEFTSHFRSAIIFGKAEFLTTDEEKTTALKLLCGKYCEGMDPTGEINKSLKAVAVIRIRIDRMTGKEAIELVRKRPSR